MAVQSKNYRQQLQQQAESVGVDPGNRNGSGSDFLCDTTLLVLGPDQGASPYRHWAQRHGGIGLHIEREFGLINWLERNTFGKSLVVIDDERLDPQNAASVAADVRKLRPDVPVVLAVDHSDETFEVDEDWPSFAVEHRPFSPSAFHRAVEVARLMASFDRENQPRHIPDLSVQVAARMQGDESLDDYMGPRSGSWIVPVIAGGTLVWALIIWLLLPI